MFLHEPEVGSKALSSSLCFYFLTDAFSKLKTPWWFLASDDNGVSALKMHFHIRAQVWLGAVTPVHAEHRL